MKLKFIFLLLGVLFSAACAAESVEVTRVIENEVEVTRLVEVTREVEQEIEVTRQVEVPVEITLEVEVTRIVEVEVEVTAVPTETPLPTPTNTPLPPSTTQDNSPPPTEAASIEATLLATMIQARTSMQDLGGMIDAALRSGGISCQAIVDTYDSVVLAPTFDVTNENPTVQNAYAAYRAAIGVFGNGARDMAENCRTAIVENSGTTIGAQQWGLARQEVNFAVDIIHPAIQSLGGE